jgi:hypothetical protein
LREAGRYGERDGCYPIVEVLDLRHFSARQLRPLLEREAEVWQERLRWDYKRSTELLLQYLESRILHGYVALDQGRLCGLHVLRV